MKIKRREFLGSAVVGTAGAVVAGDFSHAAPPVLAAAASENPTEIVPLGRHLRVSRIGIGTGMKAWQRVSKLTKRGRQYTDDMLRYCYDQGLRLFDLADLYGIHSYIARALKDKPRESYVLSTKIWFHPGGVPDEDKADADVVVKRFLEELQTDYIDLVQIHCMSKRDWPKEFRKQMDLLEDLKQKGIIKAHGISCHAIPALEAAAEEPWVDVVHARINPEGVKMDGPPEKVVPALEKIHAAGKGIIGIKIFGEGKFRNDPKKRAESVRYVMGLGCIDAMVVGFEETEEVVELKGHVRGNLVARAGGRR